MPSRYGISCARDHVAQPHVGRIEPELGRRSGPWCAPWRTSPPAAQRRDRARSAPCRSQRSAPAWTAKLLELIRPGQMHRGVVGDAGADRIPGAAIGDEAVAEREQPAVVVEARLHVVDLVARMAGRHEMLVAVLDPAHRPLHGAREERDEQFLRIDVAFDAEAAADVERDANGCAPRACSAPWTASRRSQCTTWQDDQMVMLSARSS